MNNIQKEWHRASAELGFNIITPFLLILSSGKSVEADVLVENFGGKNGTLIFTEYNKVSPFLSELHSEGFYASILSEPIPEEIFNLDVFIEVLSDWEWSGDEACRPNWLLDLPE